MDPYHQIRKYLLLKQAEVVNKLSSLNEEALASDYVPESLEIGSFSWEADTNSTKMAIKEQLLNLAHNLTVAISKLQEGTYGFCDQCKDHIEKDRLKIIPTATLCVTCIN